MTDYLEKFDALAKAIMPKRKPPRVDPKYAGLNRRMLAATVDSMCMLPFAPLIDGAFNHFSPEVLINWQALNERVQSMNDPHQKVIALGAALLGSGFLRRWALGCLWQCFVMWLFTGLCWHYWSATPGKILLRMKIVDADTGARINTRQIIIRLLGYIPSTFVLLFGFIWIIWDKRRQGWHDKMANTVVVISPWRKSDFKPIKSNSPAADRSNSPEPLAAE